MQEDNFQTLLERANQLKKSMHDTENNLENKHFDWCTSTLIGAPSTLIDAPNIHFDWCTSLKASYELSDRFLHACGPTAGSG